MRITAVAVLPTRMPTVDRTWRFALAATAETFGFVVRIDTGEGVTGVGYTTVAEHIGADRVGVERGLRELGVALVGRDPADLVARLEVERGELAVPTGIGVGVQLRDQAMEVRV